MSKSKAIVPYFAPLPRSAELCLTSTMAESRDQVIELIPIDVTAPTPDWGHPPAPASSASAPFITQRLALDLMLLDPRPRARDVKNRLAFYRETRDGKPLRRLLA